MPLILFNEASLLKMFTIREKSSVSGSFASCFSVVLKLHVVVLEILDFSLVEFQNVALEFTDSWRILLRIYFSWKFYCREDNVRFTVWSTLFRSKFLLCRCRNSLGNVDKYCHSMIHFYKKDIKRVRWDKNVKLAKCMSR